MKAWKRLLLTPLLFAGCVLGTPASGALLSASVGVLDPEGPSTFEFNFFTPIAPLFGTISYTATISGTLTDAAGDGVSANIPAGDSSIFGFLVNNAEFLGDALGDVSASFGPVTYTGTYDCGVAGCSSMGLRIGFLASGGGDQYAFQSSLVLVEQAVSEPGIVALLGLGLAGLAAARRRGQA